MQHFLETVYGNNTMKDYLVSIGIILVGIIVLKIIRQIVLQRLKHWSAKTATSVDDFLIHAIEKSLMPLLYVGILYAGINYLTLGVKMHNTIRMVLIVVLVFFVIRMAISLLRYVLTSYEKRRGLSEGPRTGTKGLMIIASLIIWALGLVFLLDNMGFDVGTVLTGLGIGGIAIALAAQTVLGDFFAYFVIFFDRPFEIGDFLIVDDLLGSVEQIGLKTTRIRSLSGEQLIFSNKDLTDSRVHNYKRMEKRRVVFGVSVTYDTPPEKLEAIQGILRKIVESREAVTFDRAHFAAYKDFGLYFEVVYYSMSPDYNIYMDHQQAINIAIYREFSRQGISFAFPTQVLYMNPAHPGNVAYNPKP